jgi:phosphomannomutase/phosphoglucomutase
MLKDLPLKIVIDCGNGAAGTVLPQLIEQMNWKNITLLYPEVDGTYPNHEADPTVAKNMLEVQWLLQTTDTDFGIGLDGDCDRMAVMEKKGKLIPGDQLLSVFALYLLKNHPGAGVVFDIKSSSGLTELLEQWNAQPIMSPSGHSIIKDMMRMHNALLGGELSCHFFFRDRSFGYDDGIYAMLRFFEIVQQTRQSPAELIAMFPHKYSSPEFRLACLEEKKNPIVSKLKEYFFHQKDGKVITIDGIRVTFPFGWGIVRASNTQAALSMRFESNSTEGLQNVMERFETALQADLSHEALQILQNYKEAM